MHRGRILLLWIVPLALLGSLRTDAADPHIEKIELYGPNRNQVLLHFATIKDRRTALQYTENLRAPAQWITLDTYPPYPEPLHYVVLDAPTNRFRFYRLRVTQ